MAWLGSISSVKRPDASGHQTTQEIQCHTRCKPFSSGRCYCSLSQFDDLPTNDTGVGHSSSSLPYKNVFVEGYTVKNVAKALPDLGSPVDIMCASSAPNALFGSRQHGAPWPHVSLHDLALPHDHPRDNVTFNMRSLTISPTGNIPGEPGDTLVQILIYLIQLPNEASPDGGYPGMFRGEPDYIGRQVFGLGMLFGVGPHESTLIDYDLIRSVITGYGNKVDVMEIYAEKFTLNEKKQLWEIDGDWEFCIDDVKVEVVEGEKEQTDRFEPSRQQMTWVWPLSDGVLMPECELGSKIMGDLGRLDGFESVCPETFME